MKGAIFDVDGTLLDSMNVWWELLEELFESYGRSLPEDEAEEYKIMTLEESLPVIVDLLQLEKTPEELLEYLKRQMYEKYKNEIPLKDGAAEYLRLIHESGVKTAIATSGYEELCRQAFTRLGVWEYIDACAFSAEVGVNKSEPDVYLLAAKRIGEEPADCVVYEDILRGINGAKKGGFRTCAVYDSTSENEADELKQTADMYIRDWRELL